MDLAPACVREALDMVRAGLGYLAAADAARLPAATQAECLGAGAGRRGPSRGEGLFLAGFTAGQGSADDGDYSAVSWLIHRTGITKGAAVGHSAWAKRAATHPRVLAALAAGLVSESAGRLICLWTGRLPEQYRDDADEVLVAAATGGLGLAELAGLFAQMYERARGDLPDQDPDRDFADRALKLATTFGGAGVVHGDLTPECAEVLGRCWTHWRPGRSTRTRAPKISGTTTPCRKPCGDWSRRACCRSGPGSRSGLGCTSRWPTCSGWRAAPPCRSSGLLRCGSGGPRAGRRIAETDSEDGAWLDGDAAEAIACDAAMAPIVTGDVNVDALEDLVRLCVELHDRRRDGRDGRPGGRDAARAAIEDAVIGKAVDLLSGPGGLASFLRRRQLGARLGGPSLPLDIGHSRTIPPGIRNAVSCATASAAGPAVATSPPPHVKCTTSRTSRRREDLHHRLRPPVHLPPPDRDPPVGLDPDPEPRRHHHCLEQGQDEGPAQPRTTRPRRVTAGCVRRSPVPGTRAVPWLASGPARWCCTADAVAGFPAAGQWRPVDPSDRRVAVRRPTGGPHSGQHPGAARRRGRCRRPAQRQAARGAYPRGQAGDFPRSRPSALLGGPGWFRRDGDVLPARPARPVRDIDCSKGGVGRWIRSRTSSRW